MNIQTSPVESGRGRLRLIALALLVMATPPGDCAIAQVPAATSTVDGGWRVHPFANARLTESSALVASRRQPGVFWTLNDSGNPAELFATDSVGRDLGTFTVTGATNVDWEDLSLGPCGATDCLYIGDIGDNHERRPEVSLYRVQEPDAPGSALTVTTSTAQRLRLRYPDGAHDAEALVVDSGGDAWIITKGRSGGVRLYRIPAAAWSDRGPVTAVMVQRLPLPVSESFLDLITGASLRPDGRAIVIRSYQDAFVAPWGHGRGTMVGALERCDLRPLFVQQEQGEGIAWLADGHFGLSSESRGGKPASIVTVRCHSGAIR